MDLQQTSKLGFGGMPGEAITSLLAQLNTEVQKLLTKDTENLKENDSLTFQLETLTAAYKDVKLEASKLKDEVDKLNGYSRQVICLIDGDGTIFQPDIIALGNEGGLRAASMLREAIHRNLSSLGQFQLWVYVFYNHAGLANALGRSNHLEAKRVFQEFVYGFNRASERFIMVDVGHGKEAADAKLKAHLEDDIRVPQVSKIVFAGCHDDSYVTTINGLVTHGFGDKLLLLRGYAKMASSIEALRLPSMTVPQLFLPEKLVSEPDTVGQLNNSPARRASPTHTRDTLLNFPVNGKRIPDSPNASVVQAASVASATSSPLDWKMALRNTQAPPHVRADSSAEPSKRLPDPKKPLSKQTPPPCNIFYLTEDCKRGASCQYGHNYILRDEHYAELRILAKKSPCPFRNNNQNCPFEDNCVHGHKCPNVPNCFYLKAGTCKFEGDGMHSVASSNY